MRVETYPVVATGTGAPDYTQSLAVRFDGVGDDNPIPVWFAGHLELATILEVATIAPTVTTTLADCEAVELTAGFYPYFIVTVEARYNIAAAAAVVLHARISLDGVDWDSEDYDTWTLALVAGALVRESDMFGDVPYIKFLVENLDVAQPVTDVKIKIAKRVT